MSENPLKRPYFTMYPPVVCECGVPGAFVLPNTRRICLTCLRQWRNGIDAEAAKLGRLICVDLASPAQA